MPSSYQ
ncbi:hypothetical protein EC950183_4034, partial [Escherichia coli 95.0183]